jgi:hypothetical protein
MAEQERSSAVPYGPPIQEAIAKGDLAEMKRLAAESERNLQETGDVPAALQALKIEIAKLSHKQ